MARRLAAQSVGAAVESLIGGVFEIALATGEAEWATEAEFS